MAHSRATRLLRWIVWCVLLLSISRAGAQTGRNLSGTLRDSTGFPISSAQVELRPGTGADTRSTSTDAQGNFIIPDAPGGGTLLAHYPGFKTMDIAAGTGGEDLQVRLAPAATLERIVVSAGRNDSIPLEPDSRFLVQREQFPAAFVCPGRFAPLVIRSRGNLFARREKKGYSASISDYRSACLSAWKLQKTMKMCVFCYRGFVTGRDAVTSKAQEVFSPCRLSAAGKYFILRGCI